MPGLDLTIPRMPYMRPGRIFAPETLFSGAPLPAGALWLATRPETVHAANTGDVDATIGATLGEIEDQSGNARHLTQASVSLRPTFGRRPRSGIRNLLLNTDSPVTQSRAVAAVAHTLSFKGTGSVARSGVSTGTTAGTGAGNRVSVTFTPTAGSLTLTITGSVTELQLETGSTVSAYQAVGASAFDVTEAGGDSVTYADFDLVDDALVTGAIAGGLSGQALVAGDGGCFVSALSIAAGGTFSIGGTFHDWTGAAPGILRAVTGDTGRMLDAVIRAGTFTQAEIAALERFYRARGGKGLLVPDGIERVVNGGFATDTNWTKGTGWTIASGMATKAAGVGADLSQAAGLVPGAFYRITLSVVAVRAQSLLYVMDGNPQAYFDLTRNNPANLVPGTLSGVFRAPNSGQVILRLGGAADADIDTVSVQRLIPREEL